MRCLERPHATSAWDVNVVDLPPPEAGPEAAEGIPDEQTVAQSDPLVGLLRMQVSCCSHLCFLLVASLRVVDSFWLGRLAVLQRLLDMSRCAKECCVHVAVRIFHVDWAFSIIFCVLQSGWTYVGLPKSRKSTAMRWRCFTRCPDTYLNSSATYIREIL